MTTEQVIETSVTVKNSPIQVDQFNKTLKCDLHCEVIVLESENNRYTCKLHL